MQNPYYLSAKNTLKISQNHVSGLVLPSVVTSMMTDKAAQIKQTLAKTRERRKHQTCHVYELKIDRQALSASGQQALERLFLEAKWFTNAILGSDCLFSFDAKIKQVEIKVQETFEPRDLLFLSSQMKQGLLERVKEAVASLAALKRQGKKVGRLKFKSQVKSIPLNQAGKTYRIVSEQHLRVQNFPEPLRVHGLHQLQDCELANANLIYRAGDYYVMVTCFRDKQPEEDKPCPVVGIDFNIEAGCQMVLDNGIAIGFDVPVSDEVKQLQQKLARQDRTNQRQGRSKHTRNRRKTKTRLEKAYQKASNVRTEIRRQVVHVLKTTFETIATQKECFKSWQRMWGKRVHSTALAGIMQQLEELPTTRVVDRFVPTTSFCSQCHRPVAPLPLGETTFVCPYEDCGFRCNRHVNAARNMIYHTGLEQAGAPVERSTAVRLLWERLSCLAHVRISRLDETGSSSA
jgi:putative transposase